MLIKIVEEDGSLSGIPEVDDSLFVVRREKKQYYIERNHKEFVFAHFIYKKSEKKNKSKAKVPKANKKGAKEEKKSKENSKKNLKTKKTATEPLPKSQNSRKIAKTNKKPNKKAVKKWFINVQIPVYSAYIKYQTKCFQFLQIKWSTTLYFL